ncbi:MAG TPA: hypothetical protein P5159_17105 [Phycisphaerae bacterium]|nr:hypothetical protein [Phycisphaerae bacterium]
MGRSIIRFDRVVDNAGGYELVGKAGRWRLDDACLEYEAGVAGQVWVWGRRSLKKVVDHTRQFHRVRSRFAAKLARL